MAEAGDSAPYSYEGISDALKKKAMKDLKENPDQVRAHIASLRRWLMSMPHLKNCRTDDKFLLRFLRVSKFDHNRAQTMLDNFCTVRASPRGSPEWFVDPDPAVLAKWLNKAMDMFVGFNDNGEMIMVRDTADWNPDEDPFEELIQCSYAISDHYLSFEETQIAGVIHVMNCSSITKKQLSHWESPKVMFKALRNWQDAMPIRTKFVLYWNEPMIVDVFLNFMKSLPFLKKKLKDRLQKCGKDKKKVLKLAGPGSEKLLPTEMGGSNGTIEELKERHRQVDWASKIAVEREKIKNLEVDESQRQPMTMNYLVTFDEKNMDSGMGTSGTYTKFDV